MTPFQAVQETIREELNADQLPPFLDEAIDILSKAHIYYRSYKQARIAQNAANEPSKGNPLVYGAALQLMKYTDAGSYAINVALVIKCTEDLLQGYRSVSEEYQKLYEAITWQYPLYESVDWKRKVETMDQNPISPSLQLLWQVQVMGLAKQILKIIHCALEVFWQVFKLSMSLCDAYLLLNDDPQTCYEACTELVAEWENYQILLKEDQKRLAEEIENGCGLADRILTRMGVEKDTTFIIDQLKQKIGKFVDDQEELLNDLYDVGEETINTIYVPGKIAPLHINLAKGKAAPLVLPHGRYPPWAGQQVVIIPSKPSENILDVDTIENFILDHIEIQIPESMKGICFLAGHVQRFYQNQLKATPAISPFA